MALFPLGILSAAGAGGGAALSDYELIETQILGSNQASVVFSSLGTYSSTYKHLQIRATVRDNRSGFPGSILYIRMNGDTGSNYAAHQLRGTGSAVESYSQGTPTASPFVSETVGPTGTANAYAGVVIDLLDVYSTTKNKTYRALGGFAQSINIINIGSGMRMNTEAISSITLFGAGDLVTGSRFSLYGIKG
jgi:hypothetical protein